MRTRTKIITGVVLVAAVAAMILPRALRPKEELDPVPPPTVNIETASMETIELFTSLIGSVEPMDVVYISPKMSGEVTEVFVKTGDIVTEGQQLCKIDTKQVEGAKISVDTAAVSLADANANLSRMKVLYESGDISAQNFEQVQNSVKMAKLQYEGAKLAYNTQLEFSTITAPIAGLVETFDAQVHDTVSQQDQICVISGEGGKAVSFSVTERIMKNVKIGDTIKLEKGGSEYQGTITEVSSMIDAVTGLFKVKASVEGAELLATGTAVKLFVTADKAVDAMTIPVDAVYYDNGHAYVYTFDDEVVHKVPIEVGIYDSKRIQVLSGITLEDQVITTWSPELYEGAPAIAGMEEVS